MARPLILRSTLPAILDSYTSIGSYPLIYIHVYTDHYHGSRESVLCASCASALPPDATLVYDAHYEGDPYPCDECGEDIETAYGPVEEEDS